MTKREQEDLSQEAQQLEAEIEEYRQLVAFHLRMERERRGLDLADVAARCGKSVSWASLVERAKNDSHPSLAMYARAMGISFALIVAKAESAVSVRLNQPK